jgi:hypothetical protein
MWVLFRKIVYFRLILNSYVIILQSENLLGRLTAIRSGTPGAMAEGDLIEALANCCRFIRLPISNRSQSGYTKYHPTVE